MRRVFPALLAVLLLTGCAMTAGPEAPDRATAHIIVTMPTIEGSDMTGLLQVQEAVNAITVPELGIGVEFVEFSAVDSSAAYPAAIAAGQRLDLMVLNNENIQSYAAQNMLLPLDGPLEEFGAGIRAISEEYVPLFDGSTVGGRIYGVGVPNAQIGQCGGLWVDPGLLERLSFPYDPEHIYTLEELDVLFARMKEAYPNAYPLGQITNGYRFSTRTFFLGIADDNLGSSDPAALAVPGESTRLTCLYEMDAYKIWLSYLRKWYQAGYIYPDSAITTATSFGLFQAGIVLSIPHMGAPGMLSEEVVGRSVIPLRLSPIRQGRAGSTGIFWTVPATSGDPDAAIRFLDRMYTDKRIIDLISWGIEGRDYALDQDGAALSLDGRHYVQPLGVFGDQRLRAEESGAVSKESKAAFSSQAEPVNFEYAGFAFDTSNLAAELLEIGRVEDRYRKLLESGCVDMDTVYPEFIEALYDAGLQRVIDEKQRQFDRWLLQNDLEVRP